MKLVNLIWVFCFNFFRARCPVPLPCVSPIPPLFLSHTHISYMLWRVARSLACDKTFNVWAYERILFPPISTTSHLTRLLILLHFLCFRSEMIATPHPFSTWPCASVRRDADALAHLSCILCLCSYVPPSLANNPPDFPSLLICDDRCRGRSFHLLITGWKIPFSIRIRLPLLFL